MYLVKKSTIEHGKSTIIDEFTLKMFGIPVEWIKDSDMVEIWGTAFNEGDSDRCEFRFLKNNIIKYTRAVAGY